jgi:hypothetical protein
LHETVSNNAAHQIDDEVRMRAMTRMLDLAKVFQLVKDSFNSGSSLKQRLVEWRVPDRFHVATNLGKQVQLTRAQQVD